MSTTDQQLFGRLQHRLLEPSDGGQVWTSNLWSREEVISLTNLRQDRFLFDTLAIVGIAALAATAGTSKYALFSDWLRTFGVVWQGADGTTRELLRSNSFEADHMIASWEAATSPYPLVYFEEETGTATIQIAPTPAVNGTVDTFYIPLGTELNGNGEVLVLPDDLAHAIEYGVLADMLGKDGRSKDPARAAYCESRFGLAELAVEIILKGWS